MVNNISYRKPFILAMLLHSMLVAFLFIRFTTASKTYVLQGGGGGGGGGGIVNAKLIGGNRFQAMQRMPVAGVRAKAPVGAVTKVAVGKSVLVQEKLRDSMHKRLQVLAATELRELKQSAPVGKPGIVASEQIMEQVFSDVAVEQQELAGGYGGGGGGYGYGYGPAQGVVDPYKAGVIQAIASQWIIPDGVAKNAMCQLLIKVGPGGVVLDVKLLKSSGNALLDRSAQTAVLKASPLPVPNDKVLFEDFRELRLTVRPEGLVGMQ